MNSISIKQIAVLLAALLCVACSRVHETYTWDSSERAGLSQQGLLIQYLDSITMQGETFYQYYFVQQPPQSTGNDYADKTILFAAGGPGRNPSYGFDNFLSGLPDYRVVYFHLRGSGFSQIPASNTYDRYLRSSFAVEDMELIRRQVLGNKPWAAVVGFSYGTVLGQRYAQRYPDKVNKLILAAAMSRHQFGLDSLRGLINDSSDVAPLLEARDAELRRDIRHTELTTLTEIIARNKFHLVKDLSGDSALDLAKYVRTVVQTILEDVDAVAGSLPVLIESYAELASEYNRLNPKERLTRYRNLFEYSPTFFRSLRRIRYLGWIPDNDLPGIRPITNEQERIASVIVNEVLLFTKGIDLAGKIKTKLDLDNYEKHLCDLKIDLRRSITKQQESGGVIQIPLTDEANKMVEFVTQMCPGPGDLFDSERDGSKRVYDVMSFYDGLSPDVLVHMRPNEKGDNLPWVSRILRGMPLLGERLKKIGRSDNEVPEAWNPANFKHSKSTLMIKGGADPVTLGNAAEHVYENALTTQAKILIEFPGIGHYVHLPMRTRLRTILKEQGSFWKGCSVAIDQGNPQWNSSIQDTRTCLITLFLNDNLDRETLDSLLEAIGLEFKCRFEFLSKKIFPASGVRVRIGNEGYRTISTTKGCSVPVS